MTWIICQKQTMKSLESNPNITPEEVAALQQQILELFMIIRSMDERIDWFSAQLESHEYRIVELENTVYFDNSPTSTYEQFDDYQADETYNWDDADRVPHKLLPSRSLIMQISPDTSFSHDGPANVLSSRHMSATHPGSSPLNPLFRTLHEQQFEDLCEIDQNTFVPSSTFRSSSSGSLSQLDYIWTSPAFPIPFLWASVFEVSDSFPTDHFLIIVHFDFLVLHSRRAPSYIKQRQQCRTCFDHYSATLAQKEAFVTEVSSFLSASPSNLFTNSLNRAGHQFKTALLSAGRTHFPKKTISLMKPKAILHELQPYIHLSHSLDHFTISLKKFTSIPSLSAAWSRFFIDFEDAFNGLFLNHSGLINGLPLPEQLVTIFDSSRLTYKEFLNQLHRSLRKIK
ncbi:hypothetical protein RhiirA4_416937 [Rhizophagus irregularis]|uniref:Endonuclease/exonuclease/phosphatase domain-containing protein n=1 Tax=Rhizophagus irregularis TaxID=588596 RepID=A0A2I1G574_9GLOM|nr:hypothetical protein RhiirA4_416937 [Rhizophagus irregularis]